MANVHMRRRAMGKSNDSEDGEGSEEELNQE